LKDQKALEIETTQAILSRLTDWAKLFGFFVGIPLALLAVVLGFLGIRTYTDFSSRVSKAREEALRPLDETKKESERIANAYKDLSVQLEATKALSSLVEALSQKVTRIEQVVKFKPSSSLTPELKQSLEGTFLKFFAYLKGVGFSLTQRPPTVSIDPSNNNAYYSPGANEIVISPDEARTADAPLLVFAHHLLFTLKPDALQVSATGLESGLADYFPSSFMNRSDFGREIWEVYRKRFPGTPIPNRNLDNHRLFTEIQLGKTEEHDAGNVWAGSFWQLRQAIGQTSTDKLLLAAWKNLDVGRSVGDMTAFPREILKQDQALEAGKHGDQIRSAFQARGLKL